MYIYDSLLLIAEFLNKGRTFLFLCTFMVALRTTLMNVYSKTLTSRCKQENPPWAESIQFCLSKDTHVSTNKSKTIIPMIPLIRYVKIQLTALFFFSFSSFLYADSQPLLTLVLQIFLMDNSKCNYQTLHISQLSSKPKS